MLYLKIVETHFHGLHIFVHYGLQNSWILQVKTVRSEFFPVRFKKHTHSGKQKIWFYFFCRVESKLQNFQCNLMIYTICCKIRYSGKSKTSFNLRLNGHRKGVKNSNVIGAWKHFNTKNTDSTNTQSLYSQKG